MLYIFQTESRRDIIKLINLKMQNLAEKDFLFFKKIFGYEPEYQITCPSRVNLIGEHTDYHESFVLPMAIDNIKMFAYLHTRKDQKIRLYSLGVRKSQRVEININDKRNKIRWVQYLQGAIIQYKKKFKNICGFDIFIKSKIPSGGGLSSSSALTMISLIALGLSNKFFDGKNYLSANAAVNIINQKNEHSKKLMRELSLWGCYSEWWYGTKGGAMDHFALMVSRSKNAILLDNRNFDYKYINLPRDLAIIICDTMVRHNQLYSGFAERRKQAEIGFGKIKKYFPEAKTIRDLSCADLQKYSYELSSLEHKRIKHPITEKTRVFDFIKALKNHNYLKMGQIINDAHDSLKNDYEVSCQELDIMQKIAKETDGCFGARITGGGFGGSIVAFVEEKKAREFIARVRERYNSHPEIKAQNIKADIWRAYSGDGLKIKKLSR